MIWLLGFVCLLSRFDFKFLIEAYRDVELNRFDSSLSPHPPSVSVELLSSPEKAKGTAWVR